MSARAERSANSDDGCVREASAASRLHAAEPATGAEFAELRLDAVTRRFGGGAQPAALDRLSLTVKRGEFIALLGPSGCGKSTALNCIAGLLALSSGSIWLNERRLDLLPPEQRGFGMVFQNYALFPHMTVRQNVQFGLVMRGINKAECARRVTRALELVQLDGQADKLPAQLSGGQQQRVAIARAIVVEPPLVLMDEPLSNLDAKLRLEMRAEIRRIHRELGRSTIYVTHDQDEALSMADRIVVLRDGMVEQIGTPREVYAQPCNLHVARFMGFRNLIELEVERVEDKRVCLRGPGIALWGRARTALTGNRAVAAIRPEELSFAPGPAANTIAATVACVEYYGRDSLVSVTACGETKLQLRTTAHVVVGQPVIVAVPPERVLVFAVPWAQP
jgi:putative spermidine/putrescine transport system ATP-binding protein